MKKFSGKTLIVVLTVVLVTAGSAFAYGGQGRQSGAQGMPNQAGNQMMMQQMQQQMPGQWQAGSQQMRGQGRGGHKMGGGRMGMWGAIEIPQEIRDKQAEMGKLSIEMRNEMGKNPINRSAIEELYKKRVELRNELSGWRMKQRLDMMEKLQKK